MCQICLRRPADSAEHVPGRASGNSGGIRVEFVDFRNGGGLAHSTIDSPDGFSLRTLCRKCNNRTGARYGAAYADFVRHLTCAPGLTHPSGQFVTHIPGSYPARVVKQLIAMFLAIQPNRGEAQWGALREFVLKRDAAIPSTAPRILLYRNVSRFGRVVPVCGIGDLFRPPGVPMETAIFSEISWPPLGIIFAFEHHRFFRSLTDVTHWGNLGYHTRRNETLCLPEMRVECDWPLAFGTRQEADRWQTKHGIIWLVANADEPASPTVVSALLGRRS